MRRGVLKSIFWSSRPVSWVNTAYPFAAAYLMTTRRFDGTLVLGTLFFLIPYNLLMYGVNDVFDYESDILNPRKGGIEGATHARDRLQILLRAIVVICLPTTFAMLLLGGMAAKLVFAAGIFMVLAYSLPKLRFKERPFLDSITSSCHFTGPLLYALVLVGWHARYLPFVLALFVWGMASHAFGAVQDIIPDRAANIGSIATVIGGAWTVRFAAILYLVAFGLLLPEGTGAAIVGACSLFYVANVAPYLRISTSASGRANAGWRRFIGLNLVTGFITTLVLIATLRHLI